MQITAERTTAPRNRTPTVLRWLNLVEKHGSQTAALEALIRQADELERLKRAVRGCGLSPALLAMEG